MVAVFSKGLLSPEQGLLNYKRRVEMSIGEARMLETDAVIFSTNLEQNNLQKISFEETSNETKLDQTTNKIEFRERFIRLKKSLRKRSVSIL